MSIRGRQLLEQIVSEQLSGVTFVMDYIQLQFNPPPIINVYTVCTVSTMVSGQARYGEKSFANLIIGLIGKTVKSVSDESETFTIFFEDGSTIAIPFDQHALNGPEAFMFQGQNNQWNVWPE